MPGDSSAHRPYQATGPGDFDPMIGRRSHVPPRVQDLADSAWLKLAQFAVTAVAIPLLAWAGTSVLDKLSAIDKTLAQMNTDRATTELRLQAVERETTRNAAGIDGMRNIVSDHEYRIRRHEEQQATRPATRR